MGVKRYYNIEEIAILTGVYSQAGNPHKQFVQAFIESAGLPSNMFTTIYGNEVTGEQFRRPFNAYTSDVIDMLVSWLYKNDYPTAVSVNGKNYDIQYK